MMEVFNCDLSKASGYPSCEDSGVQLISTKLRLLSDTFYWKNKPLANWTVISIFFIQNVLKEQVFRVLDLSLFLGGFLLIFFPTELKFETFQHFKI
jgi:hypothetical protein